MELEWLEGMGRREDGFTIYDLRSLSKSGDRLIKIIRQTSQIINRKSVFPSSHSFCGKSNFFIQNHHD